MKNKALSKISLISLVFLLSITFYSGYLFSMEQMDLEENSERKPTDVRGIWDNAQNRLIRDEEDKYEEITDLIKREDITTKEIYKNFTDKISESLFKKNMFFDKPENFDDTLNIISEINQQNGAPESILELFDINELFRMKKYCDVTKNNKIPKAFADKIEEEYYKKEENITREKINKFINQNLSVMSWHEIEESLKEHLFVRNDEELTNTESLVQIMINKRYVEICKKERLQEIENADLKLIERVIEQNSKTMDLGEIKDSLLIRGLKKEQIDIAEEKIKNDKIRIEKLAQKKLEQKRIEPENDTKKDLVQENPENNNNENKPKQEISMFKNIFDYIKAIKIQTIIAVIAIPVIIFTAYKLFKANWLKNCFNNLFRQKIYLNKKVITLQNQKY